VSKGAVRLRQSQSGCRSGTAISCRGDRGLHRTGPLSGFSSRWRSRIIVRKTAERPTTLCRAVMAFNPRRYARAIVHNLETGNYEAIDIHHPVGIASEFPILLTARVFLCAVTMWLIVIARLLRPHLIRGILRVRISERVATVDPRQWPSIQSRRCERAASLLRLRSPVRFDDHGSVQSVLANFLGARWGREALAISTARGREFADGSPLTAEASALALQHCSEMRST